MSPEKQRIAIAKHTGAKLCPVHLAYECCGNRLPDYLNDRNAMSDAMAYIQDRKNEYGQWLIAILTHDWPEEDVENVQKLVNAICTSTLAQQAEAFLRTIGKWEEE